MIRNLPWTEYTLYYTFLEGTNLLKKYHQKPGIDTICGNKDSVWFKKDIPKWKPKNFKKKKYFFIVFQSTTGLNPKEIWDKIKTRLK